MTAMELPSAEITAASRIERTIAIVESGEWQGGWKQAKAVYADACAEVLLIEAQRLRAKRRLTAALADAADDKGAALRAHDCGERVGELGHELTELRGSIARLGAVLPGLAS